MPFVMGSNNAVPSVFAVRMQALRILRKRSKFPAVMDAINPGGSGDMYAELNEEERAALTEAERFSRDCVTSLCGPKRVSGLRRRVIEWSTPK